VLNNFVANKIKRSSSTLLHLNCIWKVIGLKYSSAY